ncbi:hypothetical protein [Paraferrimonas haliotis]|uniref:hypothetical protein n=1 Tax=Paraferrimonas haliotis TaxID=2013866 RepID=UPI000BA98506|nr:hypothetical protein [Paraferrimonas haliotis]
MIELIKADRYHLDIKVRLPKQARRFDIKTHFLFPEKLTQSDPSAVTDVFYGNLLQKQLVERPPHRTTDSVKRRWASMRYSAYANAHKTSERYRRVLADFVNEFLLALEHEIIDFGKLKNRLDWFHWVHEYHDELTQGRLYRLADHVLLYSLNQAVLANTTKQTPELKKIHEQLESYAKQYKYRLTHKNEAGREKLLARILLAKRVINRPYRLNRSLITDGKLAEQVIFGGAAALAMAFATGVAFATQRAFGNFTTPFFISLVLSYIFKDRIKELGRNFLMKRYFKRFFKYHYRLEHHASKQPVGEIKSTIYRAKPEQLSTKANKLASHLLNQDSRIDSNAFVLDRQFHLNATDVIAKDCYILDILTVNFSRRLRLLPQLNQSHWHQVDGNIQRSQVHHVYPVHLIFEIKTDDDEVMLLRYRLITSRKGIHRIEKMD